MENPDRADIVSNNDEMYKAWVETTSVNERKQGNLKPVRLRLYRDGKIANGPSRPIISRRIEYFVHASDRFLFFFTCTCVLNQASPSIDYRRIRLEFSPSRKPFPGGGPVRCETAHTVPARVILPVRNVPTVVSDRPGAHPDRVVSDYSSAGRTLLSRRPYDTIIMLLYVCRPSAPPRFERRDAVRPGGARGRAADVQ